VVVRGDTLIAIAARYGVTVAAIQKANRIPDPSLIIVGWHLVIPPR
jgi:spore germination protein